MTYVILKKKQRHHYAFIHNYQCFQYRQLSEFGIFTPQSFKLYMALDLIGTSQIEQCIFATDSLSSIQSHLKWKGWYSRQTITFDSGTRNGERNCSNNRPNCSMQIQNLVTLARRMIVNGK